MPANRITTCCCQVQRLELRLLQQFGQALAAIQLLLRERIEIRAELRKGRQFAILRQIELQRRANLLASP